MRVGKLGPKLSSNSSQSQPQPHFSLPTLFTLAAFFHIFQGQSVSWQPYLFLIILIQNDRSWQLNSFFCQERPRSGQLNSFFFDMRTPDLGNLTLSFLTGALQIWATSPLCMASSSVPSVSWPTSSSAHSWRTTPLSNGPGRELRVMNQLEGPLSYEVHPKSKWKMWIKREWLQLGG